MKINFCTLFDSNYLTRGLVMYESLKKNCPDFQLFIFAFDDKLFNILKTLNIQNVSVITLKEFENEELLKIKSTRSAAEYCWTCTPAIIQFCIENYNLPSCTYLDADLFFYSDPAILLNEAERFDVLITKHNYAKEYDQSETSGIYCVQFMFFRNNSNGMQVLNWWYERCIEWCFARFEDGKFGDQKYLDDWPSRFEKIKVLEHIGGGVAPWNSILYYYKQDENQIKISLDNRIWFPLVFFHFHGIKFYKNKIVHGSPYKLNSFVFEGIYKLYSDKIFNKTREIAKINIEIENNLEHAYKNGTYYTFKDKLWLLKNTLIKRDLKNLFSITRLKNRENTFKR